MATKEELRLALIELFRYTVDLEKRFSVYAASRPSRAKYPENAREVGNLVKEALGKTTYDEIVYSTGLTG